MNKIFRLCILICSFSLPILGQTTESIPEINLTKLQAPSSPASTMINKKVGIISRSKSWRALETSLFSNFLDSDGGIALPNDFALEFSPYWMQNNLKITNDEYLAPDKWESIKQNFAISLASTQKFVLGDSTKSNALGFGFRSTLVFSNNEILEKYKYLQMQQTSMNTILGLMDDVEQDSCKTTDDYLKYYFELIEDNQNKIFSDMSKSDVMLLIGEYEKYITGKIAASKIILNNNFDEIEDIINDESLRFLGVDKTLMSIYDIRQNRPGLKIEFAGAFSLSFPTNETNFSYVPSYSIWITPSYSSINSDILEFLGVFRYTNYNLDFYKSYYPKSEVFESCVDFGCKFVLKLQKLSLELETVWNSSTTVINKETNEEKVTIEETLTKNDFQYIVNLNYQLTDDILISYNFGKSFDPVMAINGNLISSLSLNLGFNSPTNKNLK